jgi:hypothetical protein
MTRTPLIIMLAAAAALAGCHKQSHTIVAGGDPADNEPNATANAPVALPPSIVKTASYRCEDNKVLYVDWLSDGKSAAIRTEKDGSRTQVTAPEAGKPMTGPAGFSVDGTSSASTIKIAIPGHPSQSCTA